MSAYSENKHVAYISKPPHQKGFTQHAKKCIFDYWWHLVWITKRDIPYGFAIETENGLWEDLWQLQGFAGMYITSKHINQSSDRSASAYATETQENSLCL